jgi:hypothetical protein
MVKTIFTHSFEVAIFCLTPFLVLPIDDIHRPLFEARKVTFFNVDHEEFFLGDFPLVNLLSNGILLH